MIQNNTNTEKEVELTSRQISAIPAILSCSSYTEGVRKAGIGRKTFYEWLKQPEFKAELDRQRDEIAAEAFGVLSQSLTKAVEALVGLLDNKDDRLKRLACKDVIDFIIRHKENTDLEKRLTAIEQRLESQK